MKTSKQMTGVITALAVKHGLDFAAIGSYIKLENESYMPLVIEVIGPYQVAVTHYCYQNGDAIADPEVTFFIRYGDQDCAVMAGDWGWIPLTIKQHPMFISSYATSGGERICTILSDDGSEVKSFYPKAQKDVASFSDTWATNLKEQNWLGDQVKVTGRAPVH